MAERDSKSTEQARSSEQRKLDDFWDVERLLPERSLRKVPPPRKTPTSVEVELPARPTPPANGGLAPSAAPVSATPLTVTGRGGREASASSAGQLAAGNDRQPMPASTGQSEATHYVPPHKAGEENADQPLLEYRPDGALLHRVRIYGWQVGYHYFDSFIEDACRYQAMLPPKSAEKVSFFSYFPQYVQLSHRAAAWYLFWRENVRRGQYPDTDYSYVLLYLFELINLPTEDTPTARKHRDLMAMVWMAYRKPFPQLDHYMCEWLCDYCLIHALPAPVDILAPALDDIIAGSRLKEFYLSAAVRVSGASEGTAGAVNETTLATANILMRHCCQYDYRKSKFAQGEHKALFDRTIPTAVAHVLPLLLGADGRKPAITLLDSNVTRDAYVGALCSHRNKRKIEVAYTSFSRSHELRFLIGDMVKHVENRLRSWIGVRSKLSVMSLPIPLRDALDAYLNPLAPPKSAVPVQKKDTPRPAYEALYDLPRKEVSLTDAAAIEADSWETTKILVEAFGVADGAANDVARGANDVPLRGNDVATDVANDVPLHENEVAPAAQTEGNVENAVSGEPTAIAASGEDAPLAPYAPFIKAALDGDSAALSKAAKALGKMPDALADEINALTADGEIGDIILEDDGMGGYTVIEDYREQVIELL